MFSVIVYLGNRRYPLSPLGSQKDMKAELSLLLWPLWCSSKMSQLVLDFPHDYSQFLVHKKKQRHNEELSQAWMCNCILLFKSCINKYRLKSHQKHRCCNQYRNSFPIKMYFPMCLTTELPFPVWEVCAAAFRHLDRQPA